MSKLIRENYALKPFQIYVILNKHRWPVAKVHVMRINDGVRVDVTELTSQDGGASKVSTATGNDLNAALHGLHIGGVKLYDDAHTNIETVKMMAAHEKARASGDKAKVQRLEQQMEVKAMIWANGRSSIFFKPGFEALEARGFQIIRAL